MITQANTTVGRLTRESGSVILQAIVTDVHLQELVTIDADRDAFAANEFVEKVSLCIVILNN